MSIEMKFCRIATLMIRWDCSREYIYDLLSKDLLKRWPLPGHSGNRGTRISMDTVRQLEKDSDDD